jgi:anti-sigma B factor antagonist
MDPHAPAGGPSRVCGPARPAAGKPSRRPGSPAEPLDIEVYATAALTTVVISGDLDLLSAPALAARLVPVLASRPPRLVFDLAHVHFIDCAAVRLIAGTARSLPGPPVIRCPAALVRRVLKLTGLDAHCEFETPGQ